MSQGPERDPLFEVLLNTLKELWVVKDRLMVLERVLDDSGIDVSEAVERFQPAPELAAELDAERRRFLESALAPLTESDS